MVNPQALQLVRTVRSPWLRWLREMYHLVSGRNRLYRDYSIIRKRGEQMKDLKELLMEHPFFRGMEETRIELIAGCGKNEHCDEGMYLYRFNGTAAYGIRCHTIRFQVCYVRF